MKEINVELKTITPIHISSGEVISDFEYFTDNNFVYICDFTKLVDTLYGREDLLYKILNLIKGENRVSFRTILREVGLENEINNFILYKIRCNGPISGKIDKFISHLDGKKYLPGSSLKGVFKTILYYDEVKNKLANIPYDVIKIRNIINTTLEPKDSDDKKEYKLRIEDVELDNYSLSLGRINRIGMRNPKGSATLNSLELVEIPEASFKLYYEGFEIENLIKNSHEFYASVLKYIEETINNARGTDSSKYKVRENIKSLRKEMNNLKDNEIIIQVGKYGGYFTKSYGELLFKLFGNVDPGLYEFRRAKGNEKLQFGYAPKGKRFAREFPKTFTVVNSMPLGWVKLTFD
ncbi:type III-A CRISPR-associated RAMP protein Csm5 [Candidatus Micrarchaeota archaeon]|nr:type III-A CRISPR-associated RAMP protein Csm5 [Candidatus Micrarchaeota archaeon]